MRESTERLVEILNKLSTEEKTFCLSKMTRCLSLDFITGFVYGNPMGAIESPEFHHDVLDAFDSFAVSNFLVSVPWSLFNIYILTSMEFMMLPSLRRPSIAFLSMLPFRVFQAIPLMRNVLSPTPTVSRKVLILNSKLIQLWSHVNAARRS
jgi:hypothetical protein